MNKALLIIDMQKGAFTPETPRFKSKMIIENINHLARYFREHNALVVFIQHDGTRFGEYLPGTEEWQIIDELEQKTSDAVIAKTANDAFYGSSLESFLRSKNINELVITGCATDYCVNATLHNALTKDFNITLIADGHTTADRPPIAAGDVIAHYNSIWADLFPTKGKVQVLSTHQFKF